MTVHAGWLDNRNQYEHRIEGFQEQGAILGFTGLQRLFGSSANGDAALGIMAEKR